MKKGILLIALIILASCEKDFYLDDLTSAEAQISLLESQANTQETTIDNLTSQLQAVSTSNNGLTSELEEATISLASLQTVVNELNHMISLSVNGDKDLEDRVAALMSQLEFLNEELENQIELNDSRTITISDLQSELASAIQARDTLVITQIVTEVETITQIIDNTDHGSIEDLTASVSDLQAQLDAAMATANMAPEELPASNFEGPVVGQGSVIVSSITDAKGDTFTDYLFIPAPGWRVSGYTSEGSTQYINTNSLPSQSVPIQGVRFIEVTPFDYMGVSIHLDTAEIELTEAAVRAKLNDIIGIIGIEIFSLLDIVTITDESPYFFSGLASTRIDNGARVDEIIINGNYAFNNYVLLHEIGHIFSTNNNDYDHGVWTSLQANNYVSQYGDSAVFEYFAEAFAFYFDGRRDSLPQPVIDELYRMLN